MGDLLLGWTVQLVLVAASFAIARHAARKLPRRAVHGLALAIVAAIVLFVWQVQERAFLVRLLPFSNVMILGNLLPLLAAGLAGVAWSANPNVPLWRRTALLSVLFVATVYCAAGFVIGSKPRCTDEWKDGICLQTTPVSCSAAAAATFLRQHGIAATEAEMAELCLTRMPRGTPWLGLYRGMALKTADTPWRVEVFETDVEGLRQMGDSAILSVELPANRGPADPRYERDWGWLPGVRHAVVFVRFAEGRLLQIGDPIIGREYWTEQALHDLWTGQGLRLVRR